MNADQGLRLIPHQVFHHDAVEGNECSRSGGGAFVLPVGTEVRPGVIDRANYVCAECGDTLACLGPVLHGSPADPAGWRDPGKPS